LGINLAQKENFIAPPIQITHLQPVTPQLQVSQSNVSLTCPEGMVLQNQSDSRLPNEAAFCMEITEVPQDAYVSSLSEPQKSSYVTLLGDAELRGAKAFALLGKPGVQIIGPKKPAVMVTASEAEKYCEDKYSHGTLPTRVQWRIASGNNTYGMITYSMISGNSNQEETVNGPTDVDFGSANANGIKSMTGNVSEWLRDQILTGYSNFIGGSWNDGEEGASNHVGYDLPIGLGGVIGFRCVAPPRDDAI
jgi:formylglycine-generating enzyme required for sulfatase activity